MIALSFALGCSTYRVDMDYKPPPRSRGFPNQGPGVVAVGTFTDARDADADWLGAIRGGFGNPLKKLRTEGPAVAVVADIFRTALVARGLLSEEPGDYRLSGSLTRLNCNELMRSEAHAAVGIVVVDVSTGQDVLRKEYAAERTAGGTGGGVFSSVHALRQLLEDVTSELVDQVLDDPDFEAAIGATAER